jgi:hypothetical protein
MQMLSIRIFLLSTGASSEMPGPRLSALTGDDTALM